MSTVRARAPLRLGLAGGGTDVSPFCDTYGGYVLNVTIDRYAMASVSPTADGTVIFRSTDLGVTERLPVAASYSTDEGLRLHRGVYNRLVREFNGGRPLGVSLVTHVDSPLGSGLGSSSALVVAMVEALREVVGAPLGEYDVARLAFDIERREVGLNGGRQDQYAATFGGFNFMEFGAEDHVVVNPLRIKHATMNELEASLVLFFTGASRDSARIIENQTAAVSGGGRSLEAMHQLKADALAMKEAVLFGHTRRMAEILERSWDAKKRTSSAVSNPAMESIYARARASGALAGKVSGAGGGGFFMFLVEPERRAEVVAALAQEPVGSVETCRFTADGVTVWRARD